MMRRMVWAGVRVAALGIALGCWRQPTREGASPASGRTAAVVGDSATATAAVARPVPMRPAGLVRATELDSAVEARQARLSVSGDRVATGDVGYYVDVQEARLRQLAGPGIEVTRERETLILRLTSRFAFEIGRATLSAEARTAVGQIAGVLADYRLSVITIVGHTDDSGDAAQNQALSEQRALAVFRQLLENGVAAGRMVAVGLGPSRPLGDNRTEVGREMNRRVELRIEVVR